MASPRGAERSLVVACAVKARSISLRPLKLEPRRTVLPRTKAAGRLSRLSVIRILPMPSQIYGGGEPAQAQRQPDGRIDSGGSCPRRLALKASKKGPAATTAPSAEWPIGASMQARGGAKEEAGRSDSKACGAAIVPWRTAP